MASIGDGENIQVNAYLDVEQARKWARALEDAEARRLGVSVHDARGSLASRLGVNPGMLENLRRVRTKIVPNWIMSRLRAEFVSVLQNQIMRLEHEILIAKQTGANYRDDNLASAEAQVVKARALLSGTN
jgi:hypothetical protein